MNDPRPEKPAPVGLLSLLLFVSGSCALVFQVVWIRELRLIFGATTASSAAVLAVFMGGLGLGNWLFGKRIDRSTHPLRFYGKLEAGIALSAGVSPFLIDLVRTIYLGLGGQAALGTELATLLRLGASVLILAIPTLLMGGTMPAAARAVSKDSDAKRRGLALIYGLNTLGAVVGAGLANFVLLEALGNRAVLWSACFVNILLALLAIRLSRGLTLGSSPTPTSQRKDETNSSILKERSYSVRLICMTSGIVGFVFFLMELVWYRMLGPLLGGTTYTFGLILCLALLGIGIGGACYSVLGRWFKPSLRLVAGTCVLEAFLIGIPYWYGDRIAIWVLQQQLEPIASFAAQVWNWSQVGAFVILPASIVAGFQFPVLIATVGTGRNDIGKHVGWMFAANTLGAICGSLAGGFLLLPILTAPGVWKLSVGLLVLIGLILMLIGKQGTKFALTSTGILTLLALLTISAEGPTAVWRHGGIGAGRAIAMEPGRNGEQDFMNEIRRSWVWEAEGLESSVAITATDSLAFIVNGKSDGNAYGDAGTQIGLGLLGTLLHKSPQTGLVIGLGTGESAGWMADVDGITSVDVVELEPAVTEMAARCRSVNRDAMKNPKLRLHLNDAREFLLTIDKRYDLIVSEPSNPYRAGIANLYTREFYQSAAMRLAENGLFLQWLQGYEVDQRTVKIVMQTLRSVFPHVQIWQTKSRDLVFVCGVSDSSLAYDADRLHERFQIETIHQGLQLAWRVNDLEGVAAHYVCSEVTIDEYLPAEIAQLNTDNRNLLEYAFAKTLGHPTRFSLPELQFIAQNRQDDSVRIGSDHAPESVFRRKLAMQMYFGGEVSLGEHPSKEQRLLDEAYHQYLIGDYEEASKRFQMIQIDSACPIELLCYAHALAETGISVSDELMQTLEENNKTEAHAIRAIAHSQRNEQSVAIDELVNTLGRLHSDPWGSTQLLFSILRYTAVLAEMDSSAASRVDQKLAEPFAMHRLDDKRRVVRYFVAKQLAPDRLVDALEDLEPHIPWKGYFLEHRSQVYATEQHPFASRALSDLHQFQAWE